MMRVRWQGLELPVRVVPEKETLTEVYGKFVAEPFERGFGTTVGNSLRRILLSSLEGAAITAVKIDGVKHEFSAIAGVAEDVTQIILNIRSLVINVNSEEPKTLKIEAHKKGEVTGADVICDSNTEVVNKDQHIATLSDDVDFVCEMQVRRGRGYVTAEENASEEQEIGLISVDSIFSPVVRVRYKTEDTRVGQRTNYDRLILEIWTNGIITPEMALVEAAKILRKHLNCFVQYFELGRELQREMAREREEEERRRYLEELERKLNMSVDELDLSVRATNCFQAEKIHLIRDLVVLTESQLLKVRNFGKTTLKEVKGKLSDMGLSLGMDLKELGLEG
jgi:DNA-directed RNA polymerase subunit alpha